LPPRNMVGKRIEGEVKPVMGKEQGRWGGEPKYIKGSAKIKWAGNH